jgi:hypothetical protein
VSRSARAFFSKALKTQPQWPRKLNLDGNAASHRALLLNDVTQNSDSTLLCALTYLGNKSVQHHIFIRRRSAMARKYSEGAQRKVRRS